jgi:hypothetical protein
MENTVDHLIVILDFFCCTMATAAPMFKAQQLQVTHTSLSNCPYFFHRPFAMPSNNAVIGIAPPNNHLLWFTLSLFCSYHSEYLVEGFLFESVGF